MKQTDRRKKKPVKGKIPTEADRAKARALNPTRRRREIGKKGPDE